MKRVFDLVTSAVGLFFLLPFLLLIAFLVQIDSKGPALYRGVRVGRNGITFRIFKFRTMIVDADKRGGSSTAQNDPRITRVGRYLRRYKLDELPQLINVLHGEMSLVGPRPELEEHTRCYSEEERVILTVRPGITDYASVKFMNLAERLGSENADAAYLMEVRPEKNRLRMQYVRNRTFWTDIKLIVITLLTVIRQRPWNMPS